MPRALLVVGATDAPSPLAAAMLRTGHWHEFDLPVADFANGNRVYLAGPSDPPDEIDIVWVSHSRSGESVLRLALALDCLRRRRADISVRLIVPYLPYSRSSVVEAGGSSLGAAVMFRLLDSLEIPRCSVFAMHSAEVAGFSRSVVTDVSVLEDVARWVEPTHPVDVVVSPDRGRIRDAQILADLLDADVEVLIKRRKDHGDQAEGVRVRRPRLSGANVLLYDDELTTGSTLVAALDTAAEAGAAGAVAVTARSFASPAVVASLRENHLLRALGTTLLTPFEHQAPFLDHGLPVIDVLGSLEQLAEDTPQSRHRAKEHPRA